MPSEIPETPQDAQAPVTPQVVPEGAVRTPPRRRSLAATLMLILLLVLLGGSIFVNLGLFGLLQARMLDTEGKVQEKHFSHARYADDKIVILTIEGTMVSGEGFFKHQIDKIRKDDSVRAVVLRVNSPGGLVSTADYMYHHLTELSEERDLPIVVSMGAIAASGGYYVSMAVGDRPDTIYAEPTTFTGSIGVIIPHYDLSKLLEEWGVREDSIKSRPLKGMGSFAEEMTPEERAIFDGLVQDAFERFKEIVKAGRPAFRRDEEALKAVTTGQIFTAEQALENGLIDKVGFLEKAVDRAVELTGLAEDEVEVVKYEAEPTLADVLFGAQSSRQPPLDLSAILDLSVPRAFYLCSRLPVLAGRPGSR